MKSPPLKAYAEKATFNQDLGIPTWASFGSMGSSIARIADEHPILRGTILPFVRVPVNLTRQVIDYTPVVGQLQKRFWVAMQDGGEAKADALGKLSLGTGYWAMAGMLAANGRITGAAPRDPELRASKLATGWQPYSFVFNHDDGTKTHIAYNRLDPFSTPLGLAADFAQAMGNLNSKDADEWAAIATLSIVNNFQSKSYLQGATELLSVMGSADQGKAMKFIQGKVASYGPGLGKVAQPDVELKELRGWLDKAYSKIPGLSATLEPKRDIFGEKVQPAMGYPYSAINPFGVSHGKSDPVVTEMARLSASEARTQWGSPAEKVGNVDLTTVRNGQGRSAYDRLSELAGQASSQRSRL